MKVLLDSVESDKGTADFTEDGDMFEVSLTSAKTGDIFSLKSNSKRRAKNKYAQFRRWIKGGQDDE